MRSTDHRLSLAALAGWILLVVVQLGWLRPLRYFWAFNLWQYLPLPLAVGLAGLLLLLCWGAARARIVRGVREAYDRAARLPFRSRIWLAVPLALWLVRERLLYGDSYILLHSAAIGPAFIFPDVGASALLHLANRASRALGVEALAGTQALICVAASIAIWCIYRFCRALAPSPPRGALACVLILSGGLLRVLAGHIEVYAFVLMCAAAYFWAAVGFLQGRYAYWVPTLALGIGVWMHMSCLFLVPSLVALPAIAQPRRPVGEYLRAWLRGLAIGAAPCGVFFAAMALAGQYDALHHAWTKALEWSGIVPSPYGFESLVRMPWKDSGSGTKYVLYSWGHLKYLANAFFLLAPFAIPTLLVVGLRAWQRFTATPEALFLSIAAAGTWLYASLVRPFWGPYDWDLFSLTAFCVASLAAYLLVGCHDERRLAHVAALLVGLALCTTSLPMLIVGIAPAHRAGPFHADPPAPNESESLFENFERILAPWL